MLVAVHVSSMKTSRSGSRSNCPSNLCGAASGRRGGPARPRGRSFFSRYAMAHEEPVQRDVGDRQPRPGQLDTRYIQRDVLCRFPYRQHPVAMRLDPSPARVASRRQRRKAACYTPLRMPADRRRWCDPKPCRRGPTAGSAIHRGQNPVAQIHRKRLTHPSRPPNRPAV